MSRLGRIYWLARRDFLQRARSRAFLVSMLVTVGLVLAVGPLVALATQEGDPPVIGLVGTQPDAIEDVLAVHADAVDLEFSTRYFDDVAGAEAALDAGDIAVAVHDAELIWRDEPGLRLTAAVTGAYSQIAREAGAADLGLTTEQLTRLLNPVMFEDRLLEQPDPDDDARRVAAFVGLMVLYISILMFGQFVLMGVMEEKQNRVVEVVLSRVRPTEILAGKVLGIGALGLVQIVTLGSAGLLMVNIIDVADVDLGSIGIEIFAWILLWYLLGYAFYSVMYGALGATVSRQEDMQGAVMVPVILIIPGFFLGNITVEAPDALMAKIGSLVPLWSPMVMPVRTAVGDVAWWEITLAIGFLLVGTYGLISLGGRVYRGAILKLGTKVSLREAWRSSAT